MTKNDVFVLITDYKNLKSGNLLLKGDNEPDIDPVPGEEGYEYFDMTEEIATGNSWSYYGIPDKLLETASVEEYKKVENFFNKLKQIA